jgi:hypothetical protein
VASPKIPAFLRVGALDTNYVVDMRALRDTMIAAGWVEGVNLDYEEVPGLDHEYPTDWFGGSRNQQMWDFFNR